MFARIHSTLPPGPVKSLAPALLAALACAAPLAAQDAPPERRLLPLLSGSGVTLSLDSASISRSGESTFSLRTVYQSVPDSARQGPDRREEVQELDCARSRIRYRATSYFKGTSTTPLGPPERSSSSEWERLEGDDVPIYQAVCGYLTGGWAARLPRVTEDQPELANAPVIRRALSQEYPPELRRLGIGGTVTLRFRVLPDGTVDSASLRVTEAPDERFAEPARRVALAMRFRPARLNHQPVPVWVSLPITFGPNRPQSRGEPPRP